MSNREFRLLVAIAAAAVPVAASLPAMAQGWQLEAGGIVVTTPKYEGSKNYEVLGAPIIFPSGTGDADGTFQFKGIDDVRVRLLNFGGFESGPLAGYRFGRDESDDRRLFGTGDVDGGVVLGGYLGYRMGPLFPFVSYHHQVTGDDTGGVARFGVEVKQRLSPILLAGATLGTTWASDEYMGSFFSISSLQSARSGLSRFDADAGFKDVYLSANADIALDQRWTLKVLGRYSRLVGDAADSPITESENQFFAGVGLTYKFTLGN